jgi:mannose-6-phosphate isomerase-like protein (cupin superfamily)
MTQVEVTQEDPLLKFQHFAVKPRLLESGKTVTELVKGGAISCGVQVIADGGETNLHSHKGNDAIWFVLQGAATFYTTENRVVATVQKNEGLLIPREVPYWFESASEENLVVLRFGAAVRGEPTGRVDYTSSKVPQAELIEGVYYLPGTKLQEAGVFGE